MEMRVRRWFVLGRDFCNFSVPLITAYGGWNGSRPLQVQIQSPASGQLAVTQTPWGINDRLNCYIHLMNIVEVVMENGNEIGTAFNWWMALCAILFWHDIVRKRGRWMLLQLCVCVKLHMYMFFWLHIKVVDVDVNDELNKTFIYYTPQNKFFQH